MEAKSKKAVKKKSAKKASFHRGNRARKTPAPTAEPSPDLAGAADEGLCPPGNSEDEVPLEDWKRIPLEYRNNLFIYLYIHAKHVHIYIRI